MPDIKKTFIRGRMNLDLDERLVPNGEYREALNIQVSTSDDSNVGSVQNIAGNVILENSFPTNQHVCIGSIDDEKNNRIFWFVTEITGANSAILQYNIITDEVLPVIVDTDNSILEFSIDYRITGINIIDDFLFFTDNNTEPKKINISQFLKNNHAGDDVFTNNSTSNFYVGDTNVGTATKEDITVIKKKPTQAPILELTRTEEFESVRTTSNTIGFNYYSGSTLVNNVDDTIILEISDTSGISADKILLLKSPNSIGILPSAAQVRLLVTAVSGVDVTCKILSIDSATPTAITLYELVVEDLDTILFDKDFPRFAYRYKYADGEYSAFGPFTQPAFLSGTFSMHPTQEPYNIGMESRIKAIGIKGFVTSDMPSDVVEIDLLYKSDNSNVVYSIDTIKPLLADGTNNDDWHTVDGTNTTIDLPITSGVTPSNTGYYKITSDVLYAAIPSNQLLRASDNVPKKAKSQDFTAGRLIYGNYLQNLSISDYDNKAVLKYEKRTSGANEDPTFPNKSIKSLRTYQAGIVYSDIYGRETPVFTSGENCSVTIPFEDNVGELLNSKKSNRLYLTGLAYGSDIDTSISDVYYFKVFIKQTSSEYYNLVLDRVYRAEQDGNLWLSFPSSERNKIEKDDFIILKKALEVDDPVNNPNNKFKVIDIKNEAPDFIRKKYLVLGEVNGSGDLSNLYINTSFQPAPEYRTIIMDKDQVLDEGLNDLKLLYDRGDKLSLNFTITESNGIKIVSRRYNIIGITTTVSTPDYYTITLDDSIQLQDGWVETSSGVLNTSLQTRFFKEEIEQWEEFQGRFFVKILSNIVTDQYLESQIGAELVNTIVGRRDIFALSFGVVEDGSSGLLFDFWYDDHNYDGSNPPQIPVQVPVKNVNATFLDSDNWTDASTGCLNFNESSTPAQGWFIDCASTVAQQPTINSDPGKSTSLLRTPPIAPGVDGLLFDVSCSGNLFADDGAIYWGTMYNHYNQSTTNYNYYPAYTRRQGWNGSNTQWGGVIDGMQGIITTDRRWTNLRDGNVNEAMLTYNDYTSISGGVGCFLWKSQVGSVTTAPDMETSTNIAAATFTNPPTVVPGVAESVYGQHGDTGKFFMHLSFSGVGVDLHDGVTLRKAGPATNIISNVGQGSKWARNENGNSTIDLQSIDNFNCQAEINIVGIDGVQQRYGYPNSDVPRGTSLGTVISTLTDDEKKQIERVCDLPQDSNMNLEHKRNQWNPLYNNTQNASMVSGLVAGSKFKFSNDTNNTIFTIKSVNIKRLYNHTSWNRRVIPGDNEDFSTPSRDNSVHGAWTYYKYVSDNSGFGSTDIDNTYQVLLDAIKNFGAAHNRRVCYILELDKDPRVECSVNPETLGGPSGTVESTFINFLKNYVDENSSIISDNPAVFETEPKENIDLDIYYEASDAIPYELDVNSEFSGGSPDNRKGLLLAPVGTTVICTKTSAHADTVTFGDCVVKSWDGNVVELEPGLSQDSNVTMDDLTLQSNAIKDDSLKFFKSNDSTESYVTTGIYQVKEIKTVAGYTNNLITKLSLDRVIHTVGLDYYNCFSFGNGVESNRVRDDFNKPFIKNGVKASTTLKEQYKEDNRSSGLIYSGIYNKNTSLNNLNQFIMAEKITKELEPTYGSIQKLFARNSDLVAFCEDKVVQIAADKDILFNADGNPQVVSSDKVLGQSRPFVGEYGISKNPESFSSSSYRAYFTDKQRGAVLRLSMDGLTPISDAGMSDWFSDKFKSEDYFNIVGSYNKNKDCYNLTFDSAEDFDIDSDFKNTDSSITVTYKEKDKGWVGFSSFIQESGTSAVDTYFTFRDGNIYKHGETHNDIGIDRNTFYGQTVDPSFIKTIFNEAPTSVKNFSTLNYDGDFGWECNSINTNLSIGDIISTPEDALSVLSQANEFKFKEGKYFASITGVNNGDEIDYTSFNFQGIGEVQSIDNII